MRRRQFIVGFGAAAVWPVIARAQPSRRPRKIALLIGAPKGNRHAEANVAAFQQELARLGWTAGTTASIDERWVTGDTPTIQPIAAELAGAQPDVILVSGPGALAALKSATRTIPVIFVSVSDPVGQGFVASFARPGGNITGFTTFDFARLGKLMELLKELAPKTARVGVLFSPNNPNAAEYVKSLQSPAKALNVEARPLPVVNAGEIERAVEAIAAATNSGLIVPPNYITSLNRELIFRQATRHRVPAIYPDRGYATAGGLAAYGPDTSDIFRRAASYVDRVLRGENAAELPVQQPMRFELVINLKAAHAIGLTVPPTLLARADEVIE